MSGDHGHDQGGHGGGHGGGHEEHEEHEEHINHEAWVIPYADMLTLLMALFVVLFATSIMDLEKFKALSKSLNQALGTESLKGGVFSSSGSSPVEGAPAPQKQTTADGQATDKPGAGALPSAELAQQILDQQAAQAALRRAQTETQQKIEQMLNERAQALGFADQINVRVEARGLVITVVTDQVLFDPGKANLREKGEEVLRQVGEVIKGVPNQIAVEGHTDSVPINTAQFPSNWELSTARATSVLRFMVDNAGLNPTRTAAGGYADQRPLDSNATSDGRKRNRRVEIVILNPNQNGVGSNQQGANPVAKGG